MSKQTSQKTLNSSSKNKNKTPQSSKKEVEVEEDSPEVLEWRERGRNL